VPSVHGSDEAARLAAEGRWRLAGERRETGAERSQAAIADFQADFGDGQIAGGEQLASLIHAQTREEIVRRLPESAREHTLKVEWRKTRLAGSPLERNGRVVTRGEQVTRAAKAAESRVVHQHAFKGTTAGGAQASDPLDAPEIVVANRQGLPAEFVLPELQSEQVQIQVLLVLYQRPQRADNLLRLQ